MRLSLTGARFGLGLARGARFGSGSRRLVFCRWSLGWRPPILNNGFNDLDLSTLGRCKVWVGSGLMPLILFRLSLAGGLQSERPVYSLDQVGARFGPLEACDFLESEKAEPAKRDGKAERSWGSQAWRPKGFGGTGRL